MLGTITMKQLNNIISLLLSVYATVAVTAADVDWKHEPSKLIVASKNRQLAGSKSGKIFFSKGSKRSRRNKRGGVSSPSTASRSKQSTTSNDSLQIATTNRYGSDDNRIEEGNLPSSDGANLMTGASLIANTLDSVASGAAGQGQNSSSSGTSSSTSSSKSSSTSSSIYSGTDEETETILFETEEIKFFETDGSGEYSGLRTQNMIVGATALVAILLAIAGIVVQRKRAAEAEAGATILDSVEITPATAVEKTDRPSSNDTAPIEDTDYSCDIFGFNNCLA